MNPLAEQEYEEARAEVEELETQRTDLEAALRELGTLIAETDQQIRDTFEQTYRAAAANFEELAGQLFPGGSGRLRSSRRPRSARAMRLRVGRMPRRRPRMGAGVRPTRQASRSRSRPLASR